MALHDHTYVGGIPTGNVVIRGQYRPSTVSPAKMSLGILFQYKSPPYLLRNCTWTSVLSGPKFGFRNRMPAFFLASTKQCLG